MKISVLSDNIGYGPFRSEWGLSLHIEFNDRKYLLDTGASELFIENSHEMGIDLADVNCAVLSHAHYDHAGGMKAFFRTNVGADFHISPNAGENCYGKGFLFKKYIGLPKGILEAYRDRIKTHSTVTEIEKDVFVVPHSTEGLAETGRKSRLYVRNGRKYIPDDFAHEQSLVFRTPDGLVIFNSCSHSGADVVLDEVGRAFPGEEVKAYIGGLHMFRMKRKQILEVAEKISKTGVSRIITGHCTGDKAYKILRYRLGKRISRFHCGKIIEI